MPIVKNRPGFLGMQRLYHTFLHAPCQDDKPGNLDAARCRPGTGTGKVQQHQTKPGKRRPLVKVRRDIACSGNKGCYLKKSFPESPEERKTVNC